MTSDPDRRFAETVPVWSGKHIRMIGSVREAAQVLLDGWPEGPDTAERWAAREAVLNALEGKATAEAARRALIAAAKADRIYMAGVRTT